MLNQIAENQSEAITLRYPVKPWILEKLSIKAKRGLAEFEEKIDSMALCDGPGYKSPFDNAHSQIICRRIFIKRALEHWHSISHDPRFPNFWGMNREDMFSLSVSPDSRPAEALIEMVYQFSPKGYDDAWIREQLSEFTREEWFDGHVDCDCLPVATGHVDCDYLPVAAE